jgi:TrmH family RNA methyltransferase
LKRIASRDNPAWKALVGLCSSSRERRKSGKCVLEGAHAILACIERYGPPEAVIVSEAIAAHDDVKAIASAVDPRAMIVADAKLFGELSQTATPAGIVAIVSAPQPRSTTPGRFNLLLDDIQDPGNVGTMLRSAASAGVTHAFLSPGCAFAWSPKVLRAGQGAHFYLDIVEDADLPALAAAFGGKVVAAAPRASTTVFDADLTGPLMIAVGNEGAGLSDALLATTTLQLSIPMPGGFESLNAASAAAICLFEKVRQETRAGMLAAAEPKPRR